MNSSSRSRPGCDAQERASDSPEPSAADDLLVEKGARGIYEMRGHGAWADLLPARKEAYRAGVRTVLGFLDRSIAAIGASLADAPKASPHRPTALPRDEQND